MAVGRTDRPRPQPGVFFAFRPRPGLRRAGLAAGVALLALGALAPATPLAAQQTQQKKPPADTAAARRDTTSLAVDTARVLGDTTGVGQDTTKVPPDTTPPPPFVPFPAPHDSGVAAGVWVFSRADMFRQGATTLGDLLDRVPGVLAFRQGFFGEPETASLYGTGAGGVQLYVDGTPVDPLALNSTDLSLMPLANLRSVRVARGVDGLRVELSTLGGSTIPHKVDMLTDSVHAGAAAGKPIYTDRPYSYIEAQAGDPLGLNVFRGVFLAPHFLVGPVAVGVERTAADGLGSDEPTNLFNAWAKWSMVAPGRGVQLEYRMVSADRGGSAPFAGKLSRRDLTLRARTRLPVPHMVAEVYGAESSVTDSVTGGAATGGVASGAATGATRTPSERQLGLRLGYDTPGLWGGGAVRWRSTEWQPKLQASVHLAARPARFLTVSAAGDWTDWRAAGAGHSGTVRVALGPLAHFTAFAEAATGRFGVARVPWDGGALPPDTTLPDSITPPLVPAPAPFVDRRLERAGLALDWGGVHLSGAALRLRADSVFTFGIPFDSANRAYPGGESDGTEVVGSVPLFWHSLRLGGSYTRWLGKALWPYLPRAEGRGGLYLHTIPLKSGNLEITADIEGVYRGAMLMPSPADPTGFQTFPSRTVVNAYIQIRIVTVRAFLRYENLAPPQDNMDFPGRTLLGSHIVYGVKWELWN